MEHRPEESYVMAEEVLPQEKGDSFHSAQGSPKKNVVEMPVYQEPEGSAFDEEEKVPIDMIPDKPHLQHSPLVPESAEFLEQDIFISVLNKKVPQ